MLAHRVPLIVVSRQLGHTNPNITAQVYAHLLSDTQLDDVAAVFEPAITTETMGERMGEVVGEQRNRTATAVSAGERRGLIIPGSQVRVLPRPLVSQ